MRVFEPAGHGTSIEGLWRAASTGRLSHALLFEGPRGIGKFAAALWFTAGLLCRAGPGRPCLVCPGCKQLAAGDWRGGHADFLRIDPVEEGWDEIPVSAIAERAGERSSVQSLSSFLSLKALEGERRVVVVREAERLNEHAQNALLKTLEEPAPGTVLVLECSRPLELLPTVRSRTVRLAFAPPGRAVALAVLAEAGAPLATAEALVELTDGSPGESLRLLHQGADGMLALWDRVFAPGSDTLACAGALWELEGDFGEGSALAVSRRRLALFLELGTALVHRARRVAVGAGAEETAPGAGSEALTALARDGERAAALRFARLVDRRRDVDHNLDPGAVLELALLDVRAGARGLP